MQRWVVKAGRTGLDALVMESAEMPVPGPNEVRIRIRAAGLNYRDQFVIQGGHERMLGKDLVPLADGAGEIDLVGSDVTRWKVGDRVTGLYFRNWHHGPPHADVGFGLGSQDENGMLAEYVVLREDRISHVPETLNDREAATLTCAALTAWNAVCGERPVGAGSKVLVMGTGGVALFALLFAKALGAEVVAMSSYEDKLEKLKLLGATHVLNYKTTPEWGKEVFKLTGGGVNKVVEVGGTGTLNQSLLAAGPGGEVALIGFKTVGEGPIDSRAMLHKGVSIRGIAVGNTEMFEAMVHAIDEHKIKPPIALVFPFEQAKDAYVAQAAPEIFGKIVIDVQ